MSRRRWYAAHAPVSFEVEVGSECHRITWAMGRVILHDHDLETESVLKALGGEYCVCLMVLDACREASPGEWRVWTRQARLPAVVPTVQPQARPLHLPQALATLRSSSKFAAAPKEQQDRMIAALRQQYIRESLPAEFLEVLSAAWEVRRERRFRQPRQRPEPPGIEERLQAAAAPSCQEAMRQARRDLRPYASFVIECWKRSPTEPVLLKGTLDSTGGTLALSLSADWLNRVWTRGLAVVDGHFVLEVDRPAPATELEGWVIRWERRVAGPSTPSAAPCYLRRDGGRWALFW